MDPETGNEVAMLSASVRSMYFVYLNLKSRDSHYMSRDECEQLFRDTIIDIYGRFDKTLLMGFFRGAKYTVYITTAETFIAREAASLCTFLGSMTTGLYRNNPRNRHQIIHDLKRNVHKVRAHQQWESMEDCVEKWPGYANAHLDSLVKSTYEPIINNNLIWQLHVQTTDIRIVYRYINSMSILLKLLILYSKREDETESRRSLRIVKVPIGRILAMN